MYTYQYKSYTKQVINYSSNVLSVEVLKCELRRGIRVEVWSVN